MEDLSLHVLDIAENAVAAGARRVAIGVLEDARRDLLVLRVADDGPGMAPRDARRALDPFFTTKGKRTGLGLPLLAQAAQACGGGLSLRTARGAGTTVIARFRAGHVDRPPLTNMAGTLEVLVLGHPEVAFRYRHTRDGRTFRFAGRPADASGRPRVAAVRAALERGLRRLGRT